jgi:hypothetical protein
LRSTGQLENTLVAIIGDHGEAFGDIHPGNFTHKNHLFEENIRSFLMLVPPTAPTDPIISHRVAATGDIMPTLLAFAGAPARVVPGRSLVTTEFRQAPVYFHKTAPPEEWGLRDGHWKFIANARSLDAQLYDLQADPSEQHNIAGRDPARVKLYNAICERWYVRTNYQYAALLENYSLGPTRITSSRQLWEAGAASIRFGRGEDEGSDVFVEQTHFKPGDLPVAKTRWKAFDEDTPVEYEWLSPSGKKYVNGETIEAGWSVNYLDFPGPTPMEAGVWRVKLRKKNDSRQLIAGTFTVMKASSRFLAGVARN